jgi:hypothetical protein
MSRGERAARLHNMSAPPRATISFRAVAPPVAGSAAHDSGAGLRWVCRIDIPGHFWPVPDGIARDIAERVLWAETLEPERRLLAQALAEERGEPEPDHALRAQVAAMPADDVHEALREVALRTDPTALGLPAFGLLHRVRPALRRERAGAMRLVLAVLSRRRGGVFLRAADPLAPSPLTEPLDLWAPAGPEPAR